MISKTQILITGVYRSGTEYFANLLNTHPDISSTMYIVNMFRFMYNKYNTKKSINYKKLINDFSDRILERYKIKIDKNYYFKIINKKNYAEIYDIIMNELFLKNTNKKIWAEKNQLQWRESEKFIKIMNNGKVIHVLRDPRSVMASFKRYTRYPEPSYLGSAFNSIDAMSNIIVNKRKYKNRYLYIKYEDLLLNKKKTMDKVFKFLNVPNINTRLSPNKTIDSYNNKWVVNSVFQKNIVSQNEFNKNIAINGWKKILNRNEIKFAEIICNKYFKYFEYKHYSELVDNKKTNNDLIISMIKNDSALKKVFNKWKINNVVGFQQFPANPLDKKTWEKV